MKINMPIIVLLCLAMVFLLGGFFICATSVDNVFIGIVVIGFSVIFAFSALIPMTKLIQQQNKQKEDRIKKLEEEVTILKKNNPR